MALMELCEFWSEMLMTTFIGIILGMFGIMATLLINSQNAVSSEDRTVLSGLVQLGQSGIESTFSLNIW